MLSVRSDARGERAAYVARLCALVAADLEVGSPDPDRRLQPLTISVVDDSDIAGWLLVQVTGEPPWMHGFGVDTTWTDNHTLEIVASGLQDAVIEILMITVPACPGHPHPLNIAVSNVVEWICPRDPRHFRRRVGDLGRTSS